MEGTRQVPALFRSFTGAQDEASITVITTIKEGWMIKSDFEKSLGVVASKVFPTQSAAKASADGQEIIKVNVEWKM